MGAICSKKQESIKPNNIQYISTPCGNIVKKKFHSFTSFNNELQILYKLRNTEFVNLPIKWVSIDKTIYFPYYQYDLFKIVNDDLLPKKDILVLYYKLLQCVAYLHISGIEHHDLKLENCLVDKTFKNIYLIDFEFVCWNFDTSNFSNTAGTRIYLPPESFCSTIEPQFTKKDIWSLGIMFILIMYGQIPLKDQSIESYIHFLKTTKAKLDPEIQGCFYWDPRNRMNILQLIRNIKKLI